MICGLTLEKIIKLVRDAGSKESPIALHQGPHRNYVAQGELLKVLRGMRE